MHLGAELHVGQHPCWFSLEAHSYGGHATNLLIVSMFPSQLFLFNLVLHCGIAWHSTALHCMARLGGFLVLGVLGRCHAFGC